MSKYISFYGSFVDHFVDVIGRHARLDRSCCNVQHFSSHAAHFSHAVLLLLGEDSDLVPAHEDLM